MTVYSVIHLYNFNQHGAACTINLRHFLSKQDAIDNMYRRFERCCESLGNGAYYTGVNEFLNYAYIRHFEGDPLGPETPTPVYDHEWRVVTETL